MDAVIILAPGTATIVPMGMFAGLLYIVTPDWAVAMDGISKCVVGRLLLALAPMVGGCCTEHEHCSQPACVHMHYKNCGPHAGPTVRWPMSVS